MIINNKISIINRASRSDAYAPQRGISLFLAIVVMSVLLSVSLGLSAILVSHVRILKIMEDSIVAFYAADSGIEKMLYLDRTCFGSEEEGCPEYCTPECQGLPDGYTITESVADDEPEYNAEFVRISGVTMIRSIGIYKKTRRGVDLYL